MEDQTKSAQRPMASAAMVELKAELSRKKEEFRREKASNINVVKGKKRQKVSLKKKADVWDQKNAGVSARAQRDIEQTEPEEDEDALLKSKLILERKCKIYDAISSSGDIPEEDGSEGYLVDFQKKKVDALVEEREMKWREEQEEEEEEAERKALAEPIPEAENSDEEWVDYTDSLGRSKRCMRKDLKELRRKDQDLAVPIGQRKSKQSEKLPGRDANDTESPHLMSDDMYREKMRQKWEDEARQLVEKGQEEIHYANVQFDEIRTHGVGFYQFSKDQEEREAQMDKLNKLRDETKSERSRTETIKDKRKALMEARLAKVRERRKLKTKDTPSAEDDAETGSKQSEADQEEKKKAEEVKRAKEEAEKVAEEARKKFIRDWDKKKVASSWKGDGYVDSRREEREAEFAPPSMYFHDANPLPKKSSYKSDFCDTKLERNPNKTSPPLYSSNNNKNNHSGKSFYQPSSSLPASESSAANFAMHSSKLSPTATGSAPSVDVPPVHSIPLPEDAAKNISESSGVSSHSCNILNSNHNYTYNEAVKQSGDNNYSNCQPGHHDNSAGNMQQGLGSSSNLGPLEYINTTPQQISWPQQHQVSWPQQHQESWPQQQPSLPPQQVSWPQHSQAPWPQQQWPQHQPTQTQVTEIVSNQHSNQNRTPAYANPNQALGVKRPSAPGTDTETSTSNAPKKPKVPKSAILDNRFVLNSEAAAQPSGTTASTAETSSLINVQAVPYKPGSFTDAKYKHEASPADEESVPSSRGKAQISGGPMLYTQEQRQRQLMEMKEDEGSEDKEVDDKVEEFLKSVRNEVA